MCETRARAWVAACGMRDGIPNIGGWCGRCFLRIRASASQLCETAAGASQCGPAAEEASRLTGGLRRPIRRLPTRCPSKGGPLGQPSRVDCKQLPAKAGVVFCHYICGTCVSRYLSLTSEYEKEKRGRRLSLRIRRKLDHQEKRAV